LKRSDDIFVPRLLKSACEQKVHFALHTQKVSMVTVEGQRWNFFLILAAEFDFVNGLMSAFVNNLICLLGSIIRYPS